ncbi:MAG: DMT family transporter [Clostridiales Family XIII bacterium]|jgi:drug/metabolite transporter (DMT)-like permease|nr:DMT family transporter [Clostridiales Family XIII bacterium]
MDTNSTNSKSPDTKVVLNVLFAAFAFSTMEVTLKIAGANIDSFQMTFIRFFIGGIVLIPFAVSERKRRAEGLHTRDVLYTALLGIVCVPVSMLLFQLGIMHSNASTAAVLISTNPVFTIIFAHFMTADDRINRRKALSLAIAIPGIVLMVRPWDIQAGNTAAGAILSILSALTFALYTVMGARSVARIGTFTQTVLSFAFGCAALFIIMLFLGKPVFSGLAANLPVVLYIGVVVTGLGYVFMFTAIKYSNATTGSYIFFIKPGLAAAIAIIVLHETVLWNTFVGVALVLLASWINLAGRKTNPKQPPGNADSLRR